MSRIWYVIILVTLVPGIILLTSSSIDQAKLDETFDVDAIYDAGYVEVSFYDRSEMTESVIMEILGMEESFQKSYSGYEFTETVLFPSPPKYGWAIHPVVLEVEHSELGHIQIKTEIRPYGDPAPPAIYSSP